LLPLAGLTNLKYLWLSDNQITGVSPLTGLTSLTMLSLGNNRIIDIAALVSNNGITGSGDYLYLDNNYLNLDPASLNWADIQALTNRGVNVYYMPQNNNVPPPPVMILDTNLPGILLISADSTISYISVLGYEMAAIDVSQMPSGLISKYAFQIDSLGTGHFTLEFTGILNAEGMKIYKIDPNSDPPNQWVELPATISGNTVNFIMTAGDPVVVFTQPEVNPASQTWLLDSDADADFSQAPFQMEQSNGSGNDGQSGSVSVTSGANVTWLSDLKAGTDTVFDSGIWTVYLNGNLTGSYSVQIGESDGTSGGFNAFTPAATGTAAGNPLTVRFTTAGTVPENHYLALQVTNNGTGSITTDGSSYLAAPSSTPSFPVPELPAGLLLGTGIAGLSAFILLRRKKAVSGSIW